jgi:hypothetical protein
LDKLQRDGAKNITVESLVYEADVFRKKGGFIVRLERAGTKPTGEHTDIAQAKVKEDLTLHNNGSVEELEAKLTKLVETLGERQ